MRVLIALGAIGLLAASFAISSSRAVGTFDPTITLETSTTRATAHPDARITIDNTASSENIKDLTLRLPNGFWGSLGAVPLKCPQSDAVAGTCGSSTPESKIGSVTASAKIEDQDTGTMVDGVLTGSIYMADPPLDIFSVAHDPAAISIVVQAKVGGVDLGKVVINGRAVARMFKPAGFPVNAASDLQGLDTIVEDIPQEITDTAHTPNRTVAYKVETMQVDLISELQDPSNPDPTWGYMPPLLTNPSRCDTYQISATATPYGGGVDKTFSDDYTIDQCDTVQFDPQITNNITSDSGGMTPSDPIPAGSVQGLVTDISFPASTNQPEANSSFSAVKMVMPRGFGANYSAFGNPADLCPGASLGVVGDRYTFTPGSCPGSAKVGEAYIYTPLMPTGSALTGYVYLINNTPLPAIAIAVTEDIAGNLPGVNIYMVGTADLEYADSAGLTGDESRVTMKFTGLPDTPVSMIQVNLEMGSRTRLSGPPLPGEILKMADNGTANCQPTAELTTSMTPADPSVPKRASVQSYNTNCSGATITPTTGPWGAITDENTPTFDFTYSGVAPELRCGIGTIRAGGTACKSALTYTPPAPLAGGVHSLLIGDGIAAPFLGNKGQVHDFVVQDPVSYDTTVPDTTMTAGPGFSGGTGTTSDSTPQFTFNADETSAFQCSLDDGAFLPCGSASGTAAHSHSIPDAEYLEASDEVHTFAVRSQDVDGNVDLSPAVAQFKVEKSFAPTLSVALTSTQARANPEMNLTIENPSHTDIKDLHLNMPDGFFGGLTGVQSLCPVANADNGTCAAGSQVGTVDTVAVIDRSTAYITGKVFLTEPRIEGIGEPAGLTIDVEPKLQGVEFKPIRINARLSVRGEAQGLNTATLDIPNSAETTENEVSEFDLRKMVLKLKNNPAGSYPLLVNPSRCGVGNFDATFTPRVAGPDATAAQAVNFTGCGALSFGPQTTMKFSDHTTGLPPKAFTPKDPVSADLETTVTADPNGSGIRNATIIMPKGLTINPAKVPFTCAEASYPDNCPATSLIGSVSVVTPLLPEPVSGNVYMLKSPGLPKLFMRLRGRINTNIVASNRFINVGDRTTQIEATLVDLPDVPVSSFTLRINEFLTTRDYACDFGPDEWNATNGMVGWSGAASGGVNALQFDCPNIEKPIFDGAVKWKARGKKSTLAFGVIARSGRTLKRLTVKLPKGATFNKKQLSKKHIAKYVTVTTERGQVKLKAKCFKLKSKTTFEVNFCGKPARDVRLSFKKGSITTKSKKKKLKLSLTTVDNTGQKQSIK